MNVSKKIEAAAHMLQNKALNYKNDDKTQSTHPNIDTGFSV